MQALILAAGMGRRLGNITKDKTKAMVAVNGRTLIERMLEAIAIAGIRKAIIVTGHGAESLRKLVEQHRRDIAIHFVHNPLYETTNNIYSLWLARQHLEADDTLLLESDLIFEPEILREVVMSPARNAAVVAKFEPWMDGTVTVLDSDNIVNVLPKTLFKWADSENYFKTVNIYKFSREFSRRFCVPFLSAYMTAFGRSQYYEQVLTIITSLNKTELKAIRLNNRKWYEIDDENDLAIAEVLFADCESSLDHYQRLYGGYWRFPQLSDFCYLVNPYFPSQHMIDEIKGSLGTLLSSYPSGLSVQNALAARLFNCLPSQILVGNGASELIKGLLQRLTGEVGVVVPTFEEYLKANGYNLRFRHFKPSDRDFHYSVDELTEFADGLQSLIIVNPGNPTGYALRTTDVVNLIKRLGKRRVDVILDESFVDFASDGISLLNAEFLQEHPWVTIIRSISKSYGVPGLRLGILGSADPKLVAEVRETLPIWNINAFGEFFLQIMSKYQNDYQYACTLLREERYRFRDQLARLDFLRVIDSDANFFLCEVGGAFTATGLSRTLLDRHGLLIKDCTGKAGLEEGQYVRIAIRNESDNDRLVSALKALYE